MKRTEVTLELARAEAWMSAMAITPAQARSAGLVLAGHADGADELRLWLEILGLLPYEPGAQFAPCGRRSTAKRQRGGGDA